jgi:hypothetical protein
MRSAEAYIYRSGMVQSHALNVCACLVTIKVNVNVNERWKELAFTRDGFSSLQA